MAGTLYTMNTTTVCEYLLPKTHLTSDRCWLRSSAFILLYFSSSISCFSVFTFSVILWSNNINLSLSSLKLSRSASRSQCDCLTACSVCRSLWTKHHLLHWHYKQTIIDTDYSNKKKTDWAVSHFLLYQSSSLNRQSTSIQYSNYLEN